MLQQRWYPADTRIDFLLCLLLPLSWLYCAIAHTRRKLYRSNLKTSYACSVPVVVIGNIVVGGTGKTPLIIALCEFLQKRGYKPGVVSRGYGGKVAGVKQVAEGEIAEVVGDEPLMIWQRTKAPVVVGADRVAAVKFLLDNNNCDIVLSDDGLQHYRMRRDIEIAVVDANRGFGNGFCLPAGPLREPVTRLQAVDLVVYNGKKNAAKTDNVAPYYYQLKPMGVHSLQGNEPLELSSFSGKTVHAVAGIGNPPRFFESLRRSGVDVVEHAFADHHAYCQDDFSGWQNNCIIMTEKDAVKCRHLRLPDAWVLRVSAQFSSSLEAKISTIILPLLSNETAT